MYVICVALVGLSCTSSLMTGTQSIRKEHEWWKQTVTGVCVLCSMVGPHSAVHRKQQRGLEQWSGIFTLNFHLHTVTNLVGSQYE